MTNFALFAVTPQTNLRFLCTYCGFLPMPFLKDVPQALYKCQEMTLNEATRKEKFYQKMKNALMFLPIHEGIEMRKFFSS